jgi:hypothetical protein
VAAPDQPGTRDLVVVRAGRYARALMATITALVSQPA